MKNSQGLTGKLPKTNASPFSQVHQEIGKLKTKENSLKITKYERRVEMTKTKTKKEKCHLCKESITVPEINLELAPYTCKKCFVATTGCAIPKYIIQGSGEVEIIQFKAVTQEKSFRLCCECVQKVHTVGDAVIFTDCKVKYPDGSIYDWSYFFIIPPKKYWCASSKA